VWVCLNTVCHRVSDVLLRDHADHIAPTRNPAPTHDHGHDGATAPHSADDLESRLALAHQGKIVARDIAQSQAGVGALEASTQAGVDADDAHDAPLVSMTSCAARTRNMLACRALGMARPLRTSFMV